MKVLIRIFNITLIDIELSTSRQWRRRCSALQECLDYANAEVNLLHKELNVTREHLSLCRDIIGKLPADDLTITQPDDIVTLWRACDDDELTLSTTSEPDGSILWRVCDDDRR